MKLSRIVPTLAVCLLVLSLAPDNRRMKVCAADQCNDILTNGIFNTTTVNQSQGVKNDYNAWLCTTEFRTHQEARDAGISIGFPVYDIPISIGGTFDSSARDTWKSTHCSSTTDKSQYSATYQKVVSEISDTVVNAWRDCMIGLYQNKIGLSGIALSHGVNQVSMKIRWQPYDSFDTRLPRVTGFSMVGATAATVGSSLFQVGADVPATETIIDFTRTSPRQPVTLTLNTDRGSVTAFVPAQTMSLKVSAVITPTIEQYQTARRDYSWYQHTPMDDCVRDMNFDENFFPPDGYSFSSYTYEETTKNGDRTSYSSNVSGNGVHFHMHVQGDDGPFGYCKRSGWLGLNIHVTGERWVRVPMTVYTGDVTGSPLQETVLIHYPYLQPSAGVRNFAMAYVATVQKIVGDEVSTVQLTEGAPTAGGITATADSSGNLIINATQAFASWRASLGNPAPPPGGNPAPPLSATARQAFAKAVNKKAQDACSAYDKDSEVYAVDMIDNAGNYRVVCGPPSKAIAEGAAFKGTMSTTINVNK